MDLITINKKIYKTPKLQTKFVQLMAASKKNIKIIKITKIILEIFLKTERKLLKLIN